MTDDILWNVSRLSSVFLLLKFPCMSEIWPEGTWPLHRFHRTSTCKGISVELFVVPVLCLIDFGQIVLVTEVLLDMMVP